MTHEAVCHLSPERVLVVDFATLAPQLKPHPEWYPEALVSSFDGVHLDEDVCRSFLEGLDVVYCAETIYDPRFMKWAKRARTRVVLHAMPEFYRPNTDRTWPLADVTWNPTHWLSQRLPRARYVPVPVATERFTPTVRDEPTFLHIVGCRAMADRNGTLGLFTASRYVTEDCRLIIRTQEQTLPQMHHNRHVTVEMSHYEKHNYWDLYDEGSVLVGPRRYGGLSLPFNEAAAAGMGLLLSDTPPNDEWPARLAEGSKGLPVTVPGGAIRTFTVEPHYLASHIDQLVRDRSLIAEMSQRSIDWASAHSWERLAMTYLEELDRACA